VVQAERGLDFLVQEVSFIVTHEMSSKKPGPEVLDEGNLFDKQFSEVL
jgi:hypothetical protein